MAAFPHATSILPFVPRPCRDEIMSSWLSRIGCRYELEPDILLFRLDPAQGMGAPRGIDWNISNQYKAYLAEAARLELSDVDKLDAAFLHPRWGPQWFAWSSCAHNPWQAEDIYGDEFRWAWCSSCLTDGYRLTGQEYIRQRWIFACVSYCHEHREPLTNRCECGSSIRPIHVADGLQTRLICRFCGNPVRSPTASEPRLQNHARDLQIAFEKDLVSALDDDRPIHEWCGTALSDQLLTAVNDVVYALCTRPSYNARVAIEAFDIAPEARWRLPDIPNLDHKLCTLPALWRGRAIGAVLAVIGGEDICAAMSTDIRLKGNPVLEPFMNWRGSLEWLVGYLPAFAVRRLVKRSQKWPAALQKRLMAVVNASEIERFIV